MAKWRVVCSGHLHQLLVNHWQRRLYWSSSTATELLVHPRKLTCPLTPKEVSVKRFVAAVAPAQTRPKASWCCTTRPTPSLIRKKLIGPERCRSRLDTPRLSEARETTPARHLLASTTREQRAERPHTQLVLNQARQGQYVLIQVTQVRSPQKRVGSVTGSNEVCVPSIRERRTYRVLWSEFWYRVWSQTGDVGRKADSAPSSTSA